MCVIYGQYYKFAINNEKKIASVEWKRLCFEWIKGSFAGFELDYMFIITCFEILKLIKGDQKSLRPEFSFLNDFAIESFP